MPTSAPRTTRRSSNAYVATADIAKGTTGAEVLQAGLVDKEKVAKGSLPPSAITSLDQLDGKVLSGR